LVIPSGPCLLRLELHVRLVSLVLGLLCPLWTVTAGAEERAPPYPGGPVKIIVGTGPGSSPDVICRVLADHLARLWGQQVVVLNQPGGGGGIAIRAAGNAPPDGSTLYLALASNFIALPELRATLPFDVAREFAPIGYVGEHPMLIGASPTLGVSTLPELVALTRRRPGELNVAAGNPGSLLHLTAEWLRSSIGVDMTLVHYPGAPQAMTDILGGRVHLIVDALSGLAAAVAGGSIKPLAVASEGRLADRAELPTVAETFPGFAAMGWFALMAPPRTPEPVARKASEDLRTVLEQPELKRRFADLGTYRRPMSPAELARFIASQQHMWAPVIARIGLRK
jgi:tripartite-type tricarboxylate transporter receptor subunit TctC